MGLGLQLGPPVLAAGLPAPRRMPAAGPQGAQRLSAAHCRRLCQGRAGVVSAAGDPRLRDVRVALGSRRLAVPPPPCGESL